MTTESYIAYYLFCISIVLVDELCRNDGAVFYDEEKSDGWPTKFFNFTVTSCSWVMLCCVRV